VVLPFLAAEPLYRRDQPQRLRLAKAFTGKGIRTKEFFNSSVIGLGMAAFHIGFVVLFYMIAAKYGAWAPQEVNYENSVNTAFPWIAGVTIGMAAATSEEFLFRLFAIPFVKRLTRSWIPAIILPAFAWGFLHSNYPQEPGYIRGIEVGLIGILAGVVMLRWGILATLIWHYTVDATLVGLLLLRSDNLYFKLSGAIVGAAALVPLGVSGVSYLIRGRFEADESILNRAAPVVEDHEAATTRAPISVRIYEALTPGNIGILIGAGLLGIILMIAVKPFEIGRDIKYKINSRQAQNLANEAMAKKKIDVSNYHRAAMLEGQSDATTNEYLRRKLGVEETDRIYHEKAPLALWRVRYFRDQQVERYAVHLQPDGVVESVHHALNENTPGAALSKEEAQARAEEYLRKEKQIDLNQWKLVEAKSEKRPKRVDHTFTWEERISLEPSARNSPDAAHVRMQMEVQGDEVSGYHRYIQIPDEWRRKQDEQTLASTLYAIGRGMVIAGLGIAAVVIFLKNLRTREAATIPWRRLATWSAWGGAGSVIAFLAGNAIPKLLCMYDTATPLKHVLSILGVSLVVIGGLCFGGLMLLFGIAWFFGMRAFGEERLPAWSGMRAKYYRDALLIALAGAGALVGASRLQYLLGRVWATVHRSFPAHVPANLDAYVPGAHTISGVILWGLLASGVIALAAGFLRSEAPQDVIRLTLFFTLALAGVGEWGSPADFAKQFLTRIFLLGIVWLGTERIVRFNLLAYFLLAAMIALGSDAVELLSQPNGFYRGNGAAVLVAMLGLLAWPLVAWQAAERRERQPAASNHL
jgi:membrane protease YdiL (CAAX protease family)